MTRRYVIIGGGAIGAHFAGQLTLVGISAVLVARSAQLAALRAGPLTIHRAESTDQVQVRVAKDAAEAALGDGDILVLATKTQDAEAAITDWAWQPLVGSAGAGRGSLAADLPLLVLQNGVATEQIAQRRFATVISVGTIVPVTYLEPGHVTALRQPKTGYLQLGALDGAGQPDAHLLASIAADLDKAGFLVRVRDDISRRKHEKLLHNISNGVDVLEGDPDQRRELTDLLVAEARQVLEAAGHDLSIPADADIDLGKSLGLGRPGPSNEQPMRRSTWQSFARGSSSEIDYLNGEIVLLGRRLGVPTPVNQALQRLLGYSHALGEAPQTRHVTDVLAIAAELKA